MTFSRDRDLLIYEPRLFAELAWPGQTIAAGSDGQLTGTSFTSASADFAAAGVAPGMVLSITAANGPAAVEVVEVAGVNELTVSALRADASGNAAAPALAGTDLAWHIVTFNAQADAVALEMLTSFGLYPADASADLTGDDIAEPDALRTLSACGVLATLLGGAASRTDSADGYWTKAAHYRRMFDRLLTRVRVGLDTTGDGGADTVRHLGAARLRRD